MAFIQAPLNRKTLVQKKNQTIRGNKVIDFVNQAGKPSFESAGNTAYIEYQDVIGVKAAYFNQYAMILSDTNFNTSGTGLQANNRQEVNKQWLQTFYFTMPNANEDSNIDFFVNTYRKAEFADKLLTEEFINASFEELDASFELLYANRFLFGVDRISTTQDGTTSSIHYAGLADLISAAKSDTAINDIDNIDVLGAASCRNIDLTSSITDLNSFSQLNTLMWKAAQVNSVFGYGNNSSISWINNGENEITMVCWASFLNKVKAKNYQFYKNLKELWDEGKLIVLPESTLNVEKENRDATHSGVATPVSLTPSSLGLAADEILMFDKAGWVGYEYPIDENGEEITMNNITEKHQKTKLCAVNDYLPNKPCIVVKAPSLIVLDDNIVP